ncbi:MAG: GAF domain-containing sensor histidine kinase [Anaerolineales bacterium]
MRTADSPFVADWFTVSLRWLVLLGLIVSLALGESLREPPALVLAGLAAWNVVLTLLAGLNRRFRFHRALSLAVDAGGAVIFLLSSAGIYSPAFWIGLLPILTAALYFEIGGALIAAAGILLVQGGLTALRQPLSQVWPALTAIAASTLLLAAAFGLLSRRLIEYLRRSRQEMLEAQQRRQQVENERLRAIYDLTSTLTTTLNYQRVLDTALDLSLTALHSQSEGAESVADDRLVSAALLFNDQEVLEIGSARRLAPADQRITLPAAEGALARALEDDQPILVAEVSQDPELSRIVALHSCAEVYCFPLRSGFSIFGVLIFGHPEAGFFTADRREVLDIIGRQAMIAIQNARLYQELVDERDRMIEVQEEARKKLARDLHDGPTQSVAAMAMRVNLARRLLEKDPAAANQELVKIEDLARRTTKEIRHMLFTLRPLVLESQGLVAALQAMADKMKETFGQEVLIQVDENALKDIEMGKQGVIFYLVEEAVNNARKHAQAPHIWVNFRSIGRDLALLEIRDDGVGFDVAETMRAYDKRGSLGMINLRERTELVNGLLHIESAPGKGTRVQVVIPLSEEAADRLHHATRPQY